MTTKQVIRDLRALLKTRGEDQALMKSMLHERHSAQTPHVMAEVHENRVEITAMLNYLHHIKGTTGCHEVDDSDSMFYSAMWDCLHEAYGPLLDPVESPETNPCRAQTACAVETQNGSWVTRLLTAVGNCFKS